MPRPGPLGLVPTHRRFYSRDEAYKVAKAVGWKVINETEARDGTWFLVLVDYLDLEDRPYWKWIAI